MGVENWSLVVAAVMAFYPISALGLYVPVPAAFNINDVNTGRSNQQNIMDRLTQLEKRVSGPTSGETSKSTSAREESGNADVNEKSEAFWKKTEDIQEYVSGTSEKVSSLEENMNQANTKVEALSKKTENILEVVGAISEKVSSLEEDMRSRVATLEETVSRLTSKVCKAEDLIDAAENKPTTQSSTYAFDVDSDSSNAVDPGENANWGESQCSATTDSSAETHWWQVDLQDSFKIHSVEITPRNDVTGTSFENDLRHFAVEIFAEEPKYSSGSTCKSFPGALTSGHTQRLMCEAQPISGHLFTRVGVVQQQQLFDRPH